METRANFLLVGIISLLAAALAGVFAVWLGREQFNQANDIYDVEFIGPTRGLAEGGEVRFNGIKVGEIRDLSLDRENPQRVVARIQVVSTTPVREDSRARLETSPITGVSLIQLEGGASTSRKPRSKRAGMPPLLKGERGAQLDQLFEGGSVVLGSAEDALVSANLLLSDANLKNVEVILSSVAAITRDFATDRQLAEKADRALTGFADTGDNLREASADLAAATRDLRVRLARIGANSETASADLPAAARSLRTVAADAQRLLTKADTLLTSLNSQSTPELNRALRAVSALARDLQRVIGNLERDPSAFLAGRNLPRTELKP